MILKGLLALQYIGILVHSGQESNMSIFSGQNNIIGPDNIKGGNINERLFRSNF
jgi:hypothetical protein